MLDNPVMFPSGNAYMAHWNIVKSSEMACYTELPLSCLISFHIFDTLSYVKYPT